MQLNGFGKGTLGKQLDPGGSHYEQRLPTRCDDLADNANATGIAAFAELDHHDASKLSHDR